MVGNRSLSGPLDAAERGLDVWIPGPPLPAPTPALE